MIALSRATHSTTTASSLTSFQRVLNAGLGQLTLWAERRRQRRVLQGLGEDMLKDLGLSRADVDGETNKPFWRG